MQVPGLTSSVPSRLCPDHTPSLPTPQTPKFASDAERKFPPTASTVSDRAPRRNHVEGRQMRSAKPSTPQSVARCCAFERLDEMLSLLPDKRKANPKKAPYARLADWVSIIRNEDDSLSSQIKWSCPLEKCPARCNPDNGELVTHILSCHFLKYGKYKCPYDDKIEEFMPPKRRWNRERSLRDAFHDVCKLGSRGILKAFSVSKKRPLSYAIGDDHTTESEVRYSNSHDRDPSGTSNNQGRYWAELQGSTGIETMSSHGDGRSPPKTSSNHAIIWHERPKRVRSTALQSQVFTLPPEMEGDLASLTTQMTPVNELPSAPVYWCELSGQGILDGSSSDRISNTSQEPPKDAQLKNKKRQSLHVVTCADDGHSFAPSSPALATGLSLQIDSTSMDPRILRCEPIELLERLHGVFSQTYNAKYDQLSKTPRLPIVQQIIDLRLSHTDIFLRGWEAVRMVIQGRLPYDLVHLFCLAHLAHSCGQFVWEDQWRDQHNEIADDLNTWSYALSSPRERQKYREIMEQIYINKPDWKIPEEGHSADHDRTNWPVSPSVSSICSQDILSMDGIELVNRLKHGAVMRSCLQYLSTSEFCRNQQERKKASSMDNRKGLSTATDSSKLNFTVLESTVIRPLLSNEFRDVRAVIEEAADLLYEFPNTTSNELETFLVCHARYYSPDHRLYLRFHEDIAAACSLAARRLSPTFIVDADQYHLNNIALIESQCQMALFRGISPPIQELHGRPVTASFATSYSGQTEFVYSQSAHTSNYHTPSETPTSESKYYTPSETPTSMSMQTPSTETSSGAPSLFTPISTNSSSPATTTDPSIGYQSYDFRIAAEAMPPYKATGYPTTIISDDTFVNNDPTQQLINDFASYDFIPPMQFNENSFLPDVVSGMATDGFVATTTTEEYAIPANLSVPNCEVSSINGLPADPNNKESFKCLHCEYVPKGEQRWFQSNLQRHIREQHSLTPNNRICEVCQKRFTRKSNLDTHRNAVHNKDRDGVVISKFTQQNEDITIMDSAHIDLSINDSMYTQDAMGW